MKNRNIRLGWLSALLIMCVAGCSPNPSTPLENIVIGTETVAHASPVWVAENKGYFREEGLRVEIREFESGRTALQTMLDAEGIDIVTAAQTPVVYNSFKRNDYSIIGNMMYSDNDLKILARQDRGIRAPSDLLGKTVGITAGSSGHFFLGLFLAINRLPIAGVNIIDREATRLPQALIEGEADAIVTWEPHIYTARKALGDNAIVLPGGGVYREEFYLVARKDFIGKRPEVVKRFLRAIEKGEEFILKDKKTAMQIVRERLKLDREILDATWDDLQFKLILNQSILVALEDEARWAIRNKLTSATKAPNYLDYIYADALKAVKPEAVKIAGK